MRLKLLIAILALAAWSQAQTTVTLFGNTYTLRDHPRVFLDGPAGTLTTAQSAAARTSGVFYTDLGTDITAIEANCTNGAGAGSVLCLGALGDWHVMRYTNCAIRWQARGRPSPDSQGDLACAQWGVNHIEDLIGGNPAACNTAKATCGWDASHNHWMNVPLEYVAQLYSIVHDTLTAPQKQAFADKILNDNSSTTNGLGMSGAPSSSCTVVTPTAGSGTLTIAQGADNGTGSGFNALTVDNALVVGSSWFTLGTIQSIPDDTHIKLYAKNAQAIAGSAFTNASYATFRRWQAGDCGIYWWTKHGDSEAPIFHDSVGGTNLYENNFKTNFPTGGASNNWNSALNGGAGGPSQGNAVYENRLTHKLASLILMGLALADDDTRAQTLLTKSFDYYYRYTYSWEKSNWTGLTQMGGGYSQGYGTTTAAEIAVAIKNSVISGPDLTTGTYLTRFLPATLFYSLFYTNGQAIPYGDTANSFTWAPRALRGDELIAWLYPNDTYTPYFWNYILTSRTDWAGSAMTSATEQFYLALHYMFIDPTVTQTAISGLGKQYLFKATDVAQCPNVTNPWGITQCYSLPFEHAISRTGWAANDTTIAQSAAPGLSNDHTGKGYWGAYHIYSKGSPLLVGDGSGLAMDVGERSSDGTLEINGSTGFTVADTQNFNPGTATFSRYRGGTGTPTGDSSGKIFYTLVDMANAYCKDATATPKCAVGGYANVTRAQRSLVHFKSTGQDYIVSYDDAATSVANTKRQYLHYRLESTVGQYGDVSWDSVNNKATLTRGTGQRLISKALSVSGSEAAILTTDNAGTCTGTNNCGAYTGGTGRTGRFYVCPSADASTCDATQTSAEWIVVHKPTTNADSTLPTISQPSCTATGGTCTVVDIQDASVPKIAAFARQGATVTAISFTSTHSGTAQYLVAGLAAPASYAVTVNGSPISGSPVAVTAADNTVYFESTSGAINVGPAPADVTNPTCTLTAPGAGTISGVVTWSATATDDVGVSSVDFKDGSTVINTITSAPYTFGWNTVSVANGARSLTCVAHDSAGNTGTSAGVSVTVSNSGVSGSVLGPGVFKGVIQ